MLGRADLGLLKDYLRHLDHTVTRMPRSRPPCVELVPLPRLRSRWKHRHCAGDCVESETAACHGGERCHSSPSRKLSKVC